MAARDERPPTKRGLNATTRDGEVYGSTPRARARLSTRFDRRAITVQHGEPVR